MTEDGKDEILQSLPNLITTETDEAKLRDLVSKFITHDDEVMLGGRERAVQLITDSVALSDAALGNKDFENTGFFAVIAPTLPILEQQRLLEINKRMGVVLDISSKPGRMTVAPEITNSAMQFFSE